MTSSAPTYMDPPPLRLPEGPPAVSCSLCLLHSLPRSLPFQPRGSDCPSDSQLLPKPAKSEAAPGFGEHRIASHSSPFPSDAQSEVPTHFTCQERSGGAWSWLFQGSLQLSWSKASEFGFIIKESITRLHPFVQNYI